MRTQIRTAVAALFVILVLAITGPVYAQSSVDECKTRIGIVQRDLDAIFQDGGIGGNNQQQTYSSLTSKLQGARAKLNQRKFADALQKLQDFKIAVIAISDSAKSKLSQADADLLLDGGGGDFPDEGVNGAIACVALLP
jgi:hypothetical protein